MEREAKFEAKEPFVEVLVDTGDRLFIKPVVMKVVATGNVGPDGTPEYRFDMQFVVRTEGATRLQAAQKIRDHFDEATLARSQGNSLPDRESSPVDKRKLS